MFDGKWALVIHLSIPAFLRHRRYTRSKIASDRLAVSFDSADGLLVDGSSGILADIFI